MELINLVLNGYVCSIKNFSGIQNSVINSLIKTGKVLCKSPISPNKKLEIPQFCFLRTRDRNQSKCKITCKKCSLGICQKYTDSFFKHSLKSFDLKSIKNEIFKGSY